MSYSQGTHFICRGKKAQTRIERGHKIISIQLQLIYDEHFSTQKTMNSSCLLGGQNAGLHST